MNVKKAIIPAAGLGTRLLPATKAQPKEMLPIVDKPAIQYIVEEAVAAGIENIMIITGRNKRAIEDHFDKSYELESVLEEKGKLQYLEEVRSISSLANIHYIRQGEAKGLGHAINCAQSFVGNEPFAVLLGDDIVSSQVPAIKQLMDVYETYKGTIVGVQPVIDEDVEKYGIISPNATLDKQVLKVSSLIEKPALKDAPSRYAILGRYILTPRIFEFLNTQNPGTGGEIQLTDALNRLAAVESVYACHFQGRRFDTGNKLNLIKATIELALDRDELKGPLLEYLSSVFASQTIS